MAITTRNDFIKEIEATFKKHFPNGFFSYSIPTLSKEGVFFNIGLISDISDCQNKIRRNDPMYNSFYIYEGINSDGIITAEKLVVEGQGGLCCLPIDPFYAMSTFKLGFRKINNSPDKIIKSFDKLFYKWKGLVKSQSELFNIYDQKNIPVQYLNI